MNKCKNCNSSFDKNYCNNCGQKLFSINDKSIKSLLEELLHFLTHFEGTFFTTLKTLFLHPSKVSHDYCNGIRKKYFKPISLFLLVVVIYLLIPIADGLNMKMKYCKEGILGENLISQIDNKVNQLNISEDELAIKYDLKSEKVAKFLLFAMIPLSTLVIFLLFFKERKLVYETIILSTELNIFFISIYFILLPILIYLISFLFPSFKSPDDNPYIITFYLLSFLIYVTSFFYNFYRQKLFITFAKTIVFVSFYILVLIPIYRFLVFEATMLFL